MPLLHQLIHAFKGLVALVAALALVTPRRGGWPTARRPEATRTATMVLVGLGAVVAWANLGYFHYASVIHPHDMTHNYLGAKYWRELGYGDLYRCVARAETELGNRPSRHTDWVRDLRTNHLMPVAELEEGAGRCERFSPARWTAFVGDVQNLRKDVRDDRRGEFYRDHGYNASPVGLMAAVPLTAALPSTRPGLAAIVVVDWCLVVLAGLIVANVFGWRVLVLALAWWGTSYATRYHFTGGGVLRNDWLLLSVASIALVRRGRDLAGGAAIGWATLLKVFPGVLAVGLIFHDLARMWRRSVVPSRGMSRRALGALLAVALLVPAASWVATGSASDLQPWAAFKANTDRLLEGPFTNRIGLKAVLAWRPSSRMAEVRSLWLDWPGDLWRIRQRENVAALRWVFWAVVAGFLILLARASARHDPWVAMVLALGLIPIALDSSARYFGFVAAYALLWPLVPWVGPALCGLSFGTLVAPTLLRSEDDAYALISLLVVLFVLAVTSAFALGRPSRSPANPVPQG